MLPVKCSISVLPLSLISNRYMNNKSTNNSLSLIVRYRDNKNYGYILSSLFTKWGAEVSWMPKLSHFILSCISFAVSNVVMNSFLGSVTDRSRQQQTWHGLVLTAMASASAGEAVADWMSTIQSRGLYTAISSRDADRAVGGHGTLAPGHYSSL